MSIIYLTTEDFQIICTALNEFFKKTKEPPPDYRQTYFEKLDSIIAIPQKTFAGRDLYPNYMQKAACYFYFINKFHPFNNGNKRLSIVSTGVFLQYNGYQLNVDEELLYTFAKEVTKNGKDQEVEFAKVVEFLRSHSYTALGMRLKDMMSLLQFQGSLSSRLGLKSKAQPESKSEIPDQDL